jgi:hypothetical protein
MGNLLTYADAVERGLDKIEREANENKIKRYKLEELVWDLHLTGWTTPRIAKECNATILARLSTGNDPKDYVEVNPTNVAQYLRSAKVARAKNPVGASEMDAVQKVLPDVCEKLTDATNMLVNELEKLRTMDGPVVEARASFFIRLSAELRENLKLAASLKGQLQPAVSIKIFHNNVNTLCDKIEGNNLLTPEAKRVILTLVADTVFTSDLLSGDVVDAKPVKAEIVENTNATA